MWYTAGSSAATGLSIILLLNSIASADDNCQPVTWNSKRDAIHVGEIVCRYNTTTGTDVNYNTCTELASKYETTFQSLRDLNPSLDEECKNIQSLSTYCVKGFHEPLRAWDGKCGPNSGNATCLGTQKQCCNSRTFTCGDTDEDCAAGVCYEGACFGATDV